MDFNKIKYTNKGITWDKMVEYIDFVVRNSYDKNGNYHEYLKDYSEIIAVIAMFTDYDGNVSLDEAMKLSQSNEWEKIKDQIGPDYDSFHYYIKKEIEFANTPLRFANVALANATYVLSNLNNILNAIDTEALKNYDFTKIAEAIDAVSQMREEEKVKKTEKAAE